MAAKFVVLATFVAVASAGVISGPAATSHASITQHHTEGHHGYAAPAVHYAAAPVAHYAHAAPVAHYAAPVHKVIAAPVHKTIVEEHYAPAQYDFEYSVHDPHTGDIKEQKESRNGDAVHGFYSLIEADGSKRIVEYTADKHTGFNAIVHREPAQHPTGHKIVAPVAVKAIHAAPVAVKAIHAAPITYSHAAPIAHQYDSAPAQSYVSYSGHSHQYHH